MKPLAITGLGLYTSLGCGIHTNWQHISQGDSGVRRITRFPTMHLPVTIAATVELGLDCMNAANQLAKEVLSQAIAQSLLSADALTQAQLVIASQPRELIWPARFASWHSYFNSDLQHYDWEKLSHLTKVSDPRYMNTVHSHLKYELQQQYDFTKIPFSLSTACASGASAIQLAAEQITSGQTPVSIAIGSESSVMPETVARFALLTALSTDNEVPQAASKPFSVNRDGFVLGEGAAALVLEDLDFARKRGAQILGYLIGWGDTTDNFHRTRSHPSGDKIVACMKKALDNAHVSPSQVDYINAHGTGTPENDKMEAKGIQLLFNVNCPQLLVSSNKSMIGHTLSAAGAIEAVFSVLSLQNQIAPPTINYHQPDPDILFNVVPHHAIAADINIVLSNSFGFGGQNVSLVFAKNCS